MNSGYPLEWFAEQVEDYLKCGVCNKVMHNPCATNCGHVFCKDCLQSWIEYYGVCPNRCGEVELQQVTRPLHIEKRISGLLVRCKYVRLGCNIKLALLDKTKHEINCLHRGKEHVHRFETRRRHSAEDTNVSNPGSLSSRVFKRSDTNRSAPPTSAAMNKMQSQHMYRLKRSRPKEPLGLVVLSGAKTDDGKPKDFFVKKVNPDTPASKAGLRPGDRIIQIDNHDLCKISTKEAISRIKDQSTLTLTILRWESLDHDYPERFDSNEHIYDEILYADLSQPLLSQQDENFPPFPSMSHASPSSSRRLRPVMNEELQNRPMKMVRPVSPSATYIYKTSQGHRAPTGEKGSKDSGLSSGSSGSPRPLPRNLERVMGMHSTGSSSNLDRGVGGTPSYRTDQEMQRAHEEGDALGMGEGEPESIRGRIEGDYEVEEIYLEKNGTSQLGVTLGYDTKYSRGQLYVCELTPDGLAAKDGRIQSGDIIRRVNGFEVYDPEEAVLLFLEQDQDITLTVARKLKNKLPVQLAMIGQPRSGRPRSFETLDSTMGVDKDFRRIESCGSLDSHAFRPETQTSMQEAPHSPQCRQRLMRGSREDLMGVDDGEYEPMRSPVRSRRAFSPQRLPQNVSPQFLSRQPVAMPDHTFKPVSTLEQRPKTAGPFTHHLQRQTHLSPQLPRSTSPNPRKLVRPSSATPDSRRRILHQPFRTSSVSCMDYPPHQQPMRPLPQTDYTYGRNEGRKNESLV